MYTAWTQHIQDEEEKKRFKSQIISAKPVLNHVITYIDKELEALDKSETDARSFDNPSWAYKQAYKNGCKAAYGIIQKFIDLDQQKGTE